MTPKEAKKQKVLALFIVILLFVFIGVLFLAVSINNKTRTENLRIKVLELKKDRELAQKITKIKTATSSLPEISSKSYLTLAIANSGKEKVLLSQESNLPLPIASLTKLMVATIVLENAQPETLITGNLDYIGLEESAFILEVNKTYTVKELLTSALISSDNDSARLLSSILGETDFLAKMNQKAKDLGMTQTAYTNITGLDPKDLSTGINTSSVNDLAKLVVYIKNKHPEIFKITSEAQYNFCDINNFCKQILNTNKLLEDKDLKFKIIGGKTGSTDLAGKNLILLTQISPEIYLLNIVLGSKDNFMDTKSLINNVIIEN
jgi:D-alanyl-D-alanine endopeptidase (penicillin-binding protein 7)